MAFPEQKYERWSAAAATEIVDAPLHQFGFQFDCITPNKICGHLQVTPQCCQVFNKLHGGISALIAEALASLGAIVATGPGKVAGVQLSINHLKSAELGDMVYAVATPIAGKSIQVWEVKFFKSTPSNPKERVLISSSRVTIVCNLRMSEGDKDAVKPFKKFAKL